LASDGRGSRRKGTTDMPQASVKVMRSYDYCHFEVSLSSDQDMTLDEVNEMRKQAAVLVDEAVRQYQIAKDKESRRDGRHWQLEEMTKKVKLLKEKPQSDLTVEEAALLRSAADKEFWDGYHEDDYWYDDPERDRHFSMLRQFKEARVLG